MAGKKAGSVPARPVGHTRDVGWQIGVRRTLPATPAAVWRLLLSADGLRLWLGPARGGTLPTETAFRLPDGTEGEVRVCRPESQLRLTRRSPGGRRASTVQVRLLAAKGGTVVAFHEEHLPDAPAREERREVYLAALEAMRTRLATPVPPAAKRPAKPKRRKPDQAAVRALALALPEVSESSHLGTPDFRVRGKIFATLPPAHPGRACLKATSADVDALVRADPATYHDAWGGRWLGVELARVEPAAFEQLLRDAYRLAAPKRLGAALDGDDGAPSGVRRRG